MPTITDDQIHELHLINKAFIEKYRLDRAVDYQRELELLSALVKELQDQNYHEDGSPKAG